MNFRLREIVLTLLLLAGSKHLGFSEDPAIATENTHSNDTSLSIAMDPDFRPRLGTYHYKATWQNAEAATATMSVTKKDGHYVIDAHMKLKDAIKRLYQLSYKGAAILAQSNFAPVEAELYERKGEKRYTTNIKFKEDKTIESVRVKTIDKKDPETKIRSIKSNGSILDPFSAAFLARSLKWEPNISQQFEVYDGKHKFLLKLKCLRFKAIKLGEKKYNVWVLSASFQELSDPESKMEDTGMLIYMTADKARDILLIKGETIIGTVRLELEKFVPLSPMELMRLRRSN